MVNDGLAQQDFDGEGILQRDVHAVVSTVLGVAPVAQGVGIGITGKQPLNKNDARMK